MGSPWSDIIMRLNVSGQFLPTELPMCSPWADIIMSLHKQRAAPVHWAAHCFSRQPMCSTWAAHGQPTFHFRMGCKTWLTLYQPLVPTANVSVRTMLFGNLHAIYIGKYCHVALICGHVEYVSRFTYTLYKYTAGWDFNSFMRWIAFPFMSPTRVIQISIILLMSQILILSLP